MCFYLIRVRMLSVACPGDASGPLWTVPPSTALLGKQFLESFVGSKKITKLA